MGALQNIRVVDFGHYVAGPVTGMLLADQGADVIKIDPPGGPRYRSEANATWNRGKRTIELDLHKADDLAVARSLAGRADVLIENFRPGVMDRLGLGEADLRPDNRGLIYNSMPGFGPEDARSTVPAWEGVVLAAADAFRPAVAYREMMQQLHRRPDLRTGAPTYTAEPMASMFAALLSSVGIAASLNVRGLTGRGQRVHVPLFDAILQGVGTCALARLPFKPTYDAAVSPWNHQYPCQDGRWIHVVCDEANHVDTLLELLGNPDLGDDVGPGSNPDHATVTPTLNKIFRTKPAAEWEALFLSHSLPVAMCRTGAEWLQHPMAVQGRFLAEVESPDQGPTIQPAPVVRVSQHPPENPTRTPGRDAHRTELIAEAELPPPQVDRSTSPISAVVGPLRGFRVLDLGVGIAGPACGRTLAEFGAEVIKIDDPTSGAIRHHHDVNRGKRSLLLELEDDDEYQRLLDLVVTADVVIESFPPGDAEDLGLDYESLREENPDLIFASITAYGDHGPLAEANGCGETADAITGLQVRYGGMEQPTMWPYPFTSEYATGYAAAFGIILGLLSRRIDGQGTKVSASLAKTAGLLQSTHLTNHRNKQWDEPSGVDQVGQSPIQRLYQCEDGWLFLGARDATQLEPMFDDVGSGLEAALEEWCAQRPAADAVDRLVKHGMGAHELTWLNSTMTDPVVVRRGLSLIRDHGGDTGMLRTIGPAAWLSRSMISPGDPAAAPGSDTTAVLARVKRRPDPEDEVSDETAGEEGAGVPANDSTPRSPEQAAAETPTMPSPDALAERPRAALAERPTVRTELDTEIDTEVDRPPEPGTPTRLAPDWHNPPNRETEHPPPSD
ncbi:MAG: CoA transferase [Actinomycetota bacterium]